MAETVNIKAPKPKKNFITLNKRTKNPVFVKRKGYTEKNDEKTIRHLSLTANIIGSFCFILFAFCIFIFFAEVFIPALSGEDEKENTIIIVTHPKEEEETIEALSGIISYDPDTGIPMYSDSYNLFLINNSNPTPKDFTVNTDEVGGVLVDSKISTALRIMLSAAKKDGINIELVSGYLDYVAQCERFNETYTSLIENKESTVIMAEFRTGRKVGLPSKCEEGTGMSVTIKGDRDTFKETDIYKWLNNHAADYGFVFRFPSGKTDLTGRDTDFRVLRFVGKDNALKMRQLSFCLEEFVRYKNQAK